MIAKDLLDILCCPETKQDLSLIEGDAIVRINKKINDNAIKNRGGQPVREMIEA